MDQGNVCDNPENNNNDINTRFDASEKRIRSLTDRLASTITTLETALFTQNSIKTSQINIKTSIISICDNNVVLHKTTHNDFSSDYLPKNDNICLIPTHQKKHDICLMPSHDIH